MPYDVLDLDDRVVDQNAGRERDRQQAHHVEREAEHVHHPERRQDRQRQRDGRDDGGAQVAQEQEHDQHGERRAFVEGVQRGVVIAERVDDRAVDQLEFDVRDARP